MNGVAVGVTTGPTVGVSSAGGTGSEATGESATPGEAGLQAGSAARSANAVMTERKVAPAGLGLIHDAPDARARMAVAAPAAANSSKAMCKVDIGAPSFVD